MSGPPSRKKDALDYSRFDAIVVSDDDEEEGGDGGGGGDGAEAFDEDEDEESDEELSSAGSAGDDSGSQRSPEEDGDQSPDEEQHDCFRCTSQGGDASAGTVSAGTAVPQAPPVYCTCGRCGAALGGLQRPGGSCQSTASKTDGDGAAEDASAVDSGEADGSVEGAKPGAAGQPGGPPHCALHAGAPLPALPPLGEERYDGELDSQGQRHGYGRYVWRNGAVYEGQVRGWRAVLPGPVQAY